MWKIGARDAALPFVAAVALIGATHVAPAAARFGAAAAHNGAAAPRAVGYSPHMGGPRGSLPRAGAGVHSSAAGRVTSPSLSRPTFHANRLAGRSSAGSLRGHGPTTARTVHSRKSAALAKTVRRNAPELRGPLAGPAYVRPRYHGGFTGWSGPLFWAYAYADVYNSIVWPYGDSVGSIGVPGGPPRLTHGRAGTPAGQAHEIAQFCGDRTPGLTDWPIERIEQTVAPTQAQQSALLQLKTASANAVEVLHAACPIDAVATPLARLGAMAKRLDAMLRAVDLVRRPSRASTIPCATSRRPASTPSDTRQRAAARNRHRARGRTAKLQDGFLQ